VNGAGGRERDRPCGANAAPYVLGALSEEESRDFDRHLDSCAVCREEVAELHMVADALPAAAPQLKAPPQLRERVIASVRAQVRAQEATTAVGRAERRPSLGAGRLLRGERRAPRVAAAGLAAAAAAIALALIALTAGSGTPSSRVIRAQVSATGASAVLRLSDGHAMLDVSDLPQAPPNRVYEVWVKRGGAPQPTDALFTVTRSGAASVGVPGAIGGVRAVMVTSEPLGGSTVPTTQPVIVANID
jgi:anti-sigma-K factor RskA